MWSATATPSGIHNDHAGDPPGRRESGVGVVHRPHHDGVVEPDRIAEHTLCLVGPAECPVRYELILSFDPDHVVELRASEGVALFDRSVVGAGAGIADEPGVSVGDRHRRQIGVPVGRTGSTLQPYGVLPRPRPEQCLRQDRSQKPPPRRELRGFPRRQTMRLRRGRSATRCGAPSPASASPSRTEPRRSAGSSDTAITRPSSQSPYCGTGPSRTPSRARNWAAAAIALRGPRSEHRRAPPASSASRGRTGGRTPSLRSSNRQGACAGAVDG